ncbi:glycoside hydrolase family 127 protein [Pengzhenrongella frigida]|uniref:Glycoside hydrolase family 127 protein n=1 Tax=Pengzhenrongella frigida TaxID=1259133 RepID=A0A4Q5MYF8_9MICO|nr:beta-L-arabinofuranosidase domain-containing protein [Cellulomonas sp. HLT2-17]RYV49943.1 glycoside hydrolase family 127 protein [Cellulomonas sp. HLT2-17]
MTTTHAHAHPAADLPAAPSSPTDGRPVAPSQGTRRGLGIGEITVTGGFWAGRQDINSTSTLQHCGAWMDRLGWLANFDRVADGTTGPGRPGWQFSDSEVYKLMEALAWDFGRTQDPRTDQVLRDLTARIAGAQDDDGYLNTFFGHVGQKGRYSDLEMGHELYCVGHLLQAAVARLRTSGADPLVDIARRAADHVCREFGPDGREAICGHPEIELGLVELGRALGEPRYGAQAQLFVERRGRGLLGALPLLSPSYFQDDIPVREATVWRGHAVRALYLTAAAVDVAVDTGDDDLLAVLEKQWTTSVARRTYITGGMGSRHQDEGFGEDWELPPDRAYCETCAGIASNMVSWRLFLATGDVRYADLMERTFYNVIATSPDPDGRAFFYANPLQQRTAGEPTAPDAVNPRAEGAARAPWFDVSCCPTNVARTLATWQLYAGTVDDDGTVSVLQYAPSTVRLSLPDGDRLVLEVETDYPRSGIIVVRVEVAPDRPVRLRLRVPSWATGTALVEGGRRTPAAPGFVTVHRTLVPGEQLRLELPVAARFSWPDRRIDAVRGCVAVERGPVVLCVESTDLPDDLVLEDLRLDLSTGLADAEPGAVVQAVFTSGEARSESESESQPEGDGDGEAGLPYRAALRRSPETAPVGVRLVPYHSWAERGPATMRVFLPTT